MAVPTNPGMTDAQATTAASRAMQSNVAPTADVTAEQQQILEQTGELAASNFINGSPDPSIQQFMSTLAPGFTPAPRAASAFADPNMTMELTPEQLQTAGNIARNEGLAPALGSVAASEQKRADALQGELDKIRQFTPASRRPGVERILGELDKAINEPEEGSQLAVIRERQQNLRTEIFSNKQNYENAVNGLGQFKYDPYKVFPTAGSKAAALIGIALGGIGAALTGGENEVFNYFNDVVNRELQRQKLEADNLAQQAGAFQNLYTMNRELLGDEQAAEKLTLSQIAKSYQLQIEAHIADIGDINKQKIAQQKADAALSKFKLEQDAMLEKQKKVSDSEIKRADTRYVTSTTAGATAGQLEKALGNVKDIKTQLNEIKDDEDKLSVTDRIFSQAALAVSQGDSNEMKIAFDAIMEDETFQPYVELASTLRPIAFGLAREGQSASSISNRDVAMFLSILADPVRNVDSIEASLEFLAAKSRRDEIIYKEAAKRSGERLVDVVQDLTRRGKIAADMDLATYLIKKDTRFKALGEKLQTDFPAVGR